ncbi:hypothetical protein ACH5RR_029831 [Cinchona calisaya]|uniref:Uncharacterized protein n=1 Tax=Cinchona calisaya TaxID=153742 RepID=A0ABD2YWN2_9GENT
MEGGAGSSKEPSIPYLNRTPTEEEVFQLELLQIEKQKGQLAELIRPLSHSLNPCLIDQTNDNTIVPVDNFNGASILGTKEVYKEPSNSRVLVEQPPIIPASLVVANGDLSVISGEDDQIESQNQEEDLEVQNLNSNNENDEEIVVVVVELLDVAKRKV